MFILSKHLTVYVITKNYIAVVVKKTSKLIKVIKFDRNDMATLTVGIHTTEYEKL